jgi:hypothetical protein
VYDICAHVRQCAYDSLNNTDTKVTLDGMMTRPLTLQHPRLRSRMKVVFLLCLCAVSAWGYSSGAPSKVCDTLTPTHSKGTILPRSSGSPYAIASQVPRVSQGNSLKLIVSSPQEASFQGFMVQGRNPAVPLKPLGKFTVLPKETQAINCGDGLEVG